MFNTTTVHDLLDIFGGGEEETPLLCVTADSGVGKSSVLAKLVEEAKQVGHLTFTGHVNLQYSCVQLKRPINQQ